MTFDDMRRRGAAVRDIPLPHVLTCWGASRDRRDKRQWRTAVGPLSVTGSKFMSWHRQVGGGGAIDLVMHLGEMDYLEAVMWLEKHFSSHTAVLSASGGPTPSASSGKQPESRVLQLPVPDHDKLEQVRRYLIYQRCLEASILEPLLAAEKIYADGRGNAVFLMVAGKANRPIGAELRGTAHRVWRGMAPGSRKDSGYFWVGANGSTRIVLCESAIDAISCFQRNRACICISTAGVRANPCWLSGLIARSFEIHCGFDADPPGDRSAIAMIAQHPSIQRLRPPAHDWNDVLRDGSC
jgi:hypothetical protein